MRSHERIAKRQGFSFVRAKSGILEFVLNSNGLKVLMVEDHARPIGLVQTCFRVGSRNEYPGCTGWSHVREHIGFKDTLNFNHANGNNLDACFHRWGALYNAYTNQDFTSYYELLTIDRMSEGLAIEFDRMRNLRCDEANFRSEVSVVLNEMKQYENEPMEALDDHGRAIAYLRHAYRCSVIGYEEDVAGAALGQMMSFYDNFYWPNNTTLILYGDLQIERELELIQKYASSIPHSPSPIPEVHIKEPPQLGKRTFVLEQPGSLPLLWMGFHIPEARHEHIHTLDLVASVLGTSFHQSSRLYRRLIDTKLVAQVNVAAETKHDPGLLVVKAAVLPNVDVQQVENAITEEIQRLACEPISQSELETVKQRSLTALKLARIDPIRFVSLLVESESCADWCWGINFEANLSAVEPEDVMEVVDRYLLPSNCTVGYSIPKTSSSCLTLPVTSDSKPKASTKTTTIVQPGQTSFASQVLETVLPNGLKILAMPMKNRGDATAIHGFIPSGSYYLPYNKQMLTSFATALLLKGSRKYNRDETAQILDELGGLGTCLSKPQCGNFNTAFSARVLTSKLGKLLDLFLDMICHPIFDAEELSRMKYRTQSSMVDNMQDPDEVAGNRLLRTIYSPESIYGTTSFEEMIVDINNVNREDIVAFHKNTYTPRGTIIAIVSPEPDFAIDQITKYLGCWEGEAVPEVDQTKLFISANYTGDKEIRINMEDKASVAVSIGLPSSLHYGAKDYHSAIIANAVLGKSMLSSRLSQEVREKNGLTYGINSSFGDLSYPGSPWGISMLTKPGDLKRALELTRRVVQEYVDNGITDQELVDIKGNKKGMMQTGALRGIANVATQLAMFEKIGFGVKALDQYVAVIDALTKDQVNEAARRYFKINDAITVVAGTLPE